MKADPKRSSGSTEPDMRSFGRPLLRDERVAAQPISVRLHYFQARGILGRRPHFRSSVRRRLSCDRKRDASNEWVATINRRAVITRVTKPRRDSRRFHSHS